MERPEAVDLLTTLFTLTRVIAVIVLSGFLLLKSLVFRRAGKFGAAIAKSNLSVVVAFFGSVMLALGFGFFGTWPWSIGIILVIMVYVVKAAQQMSSLYGGWSNLLNEAKLTLRDLRGEWRRQPLGMKLAILILLLDLFAAVALSEVRGVPRELIIPPPQVKVQSEATPADASQNEQGV